MVRLVTVLLAAQLLSGCAVVTKCAGEGGDVEALQCAAAAGDRQAMVELGKRFETGAGVEPDVAQAARFYRRAAQPSSGTTFVYSPAVGREAMGQVIPVRIGPTIPGLPEAQYRLALLYLRGDGVEQNEADAIRLLELAAAAGYQPAQSALAALKLR
jgi:hypothetical protein